MGLELGQVVAGDKLALVYQIGSKASALYRSSEALTGGVRHFIDLNTDHDGIV